MGQRLSVVVIEDGEILCGIYNQWGGYNYKVHSIMDLAFSIMRMEDATFKEKGYSPMERAVYYTSMLIDGLNSLEKDGGENPTVERQDAEEYRINMNLLKARNIELGQGSNQILLRESAIELLGQAEGYAILDIGEKLSTHIKNKINNGRYYLNNPEAFSRLQVRSSQDVEDDIDILMQGEESNFGEVLGNDEVVIFHLNEHREGSLY
ncbi:hypothetical protein [Helicobacter typhlonius]|uniref:hypothetical protein n=1 Tax=Helicobacter typhlonius TaxID=76936 RepID=UPI002FE10250